MDYRKAYEYWLNAECFDEETKQELRGISDEKEITDRFYKDLEFGTAGLRGVIGAGTNRMNKYVIRKTTQGISNYIIKQNACDRGVAIAMDSRHMSDEFALEAALCLCANGIKAYLFESLRPTPELSFAVRYKGCIAGINITASHNPASYNGYKVYWEDGAQITPPHDMLITDEVLKVNDYGSVKTMSKEAAEEAGLLEIIGAEVDDAYMSVVKQQLKNPQAVKLMADKLKIVYSPLHGTGRVPVMRVLREIGFKNVFIVKEQEEPDGAFPTVSYPNPEATEAFELGLKLAEKVDADIVLATDPDADRIGVYVKDSTSSEYIALTGNMSGCLLAEYEISQFKEKACLPKDGALIKTIVTSNLANAIADYYGVRLIEVLTGFKYIGQKILEFEENKCGSYLFGFEESYGSLIGTYARDKDAIVATMALCEAAAFYKTKNKSLWDVMVEMYDRYGYYRDGICSITSEGKEGLEKIASIMESLRNDAPDKICNLKVLKVRDYKKNIIIDKEQGLTHPTGLPVSNVLYFELEEEAWVCVRPSGTEPKIKLYFGIRGNSFADAKQKEKAMDKAVREMID